MTVKSIESERIRRKRISFIKKNTEIITHENGTKTIIRPMKKVCDECGFHIRSKNHCEGKHHQNNIIRED